MLLEALDWPDASKNEVGVADDEVLEEVVVVEEGGAFVVVEDKLEPNVAKLVVVGTKVEEESELVICC